MARLSACMLHPTDEALQESLYQIGELFPFIPDDQISFPNGHDEKAAIIQQAENLRQM
jgi:hypothetical protein